MRERQDSNATRVLVKPPFIRERINQFLWEVLPDTTTLHEAERLACEIIYMIDMSWQEAEMKLASARAMEVKNAKSP